MRDGKLDGMQSFDMVIQNLIETEDYHDGRRSGVCYEPETICAGVEGSVFVGRFSPRGSRNFARIRAGEFQLADDPA